MAQVVPDEATGNVTLTIDGGETAAVKAFAAEHLPVLKRVGRLLGEVAPEIHEAAGFIESLLNSPEGGSTFTLSAPHARHLSGLLNAHVPELQAVLAIVDSPVARQVLTLAQALL